MGTFYSPIIAHACPVLDVFENRGLFLHVAHSTLIHCLPPWLHSLWLLHKQVQPKLSIRFCLKVGEMHRERKSAYPCHQAQPDELSLPCFCLHSVIRHGRAGQLLFDDAFRSQKCEMPCVAVSRITPCLVHSNLMLLCLPQHSLKTRPLETPLGRKDVVNNWGGYERAWSLSATSEIVWDLVRAFAPSRISLWVTAVFFADALWEVVQEALAARTKCFNSFYFEFPLFPLYVKDLILY